MKPLSCVIPQVLDPYEASFKSQDKSQDAQIWRVWNRVVGEQIAQRAQPDHLKGSLLYVEVKAPEWLRPLQEIGPQLLENLNKALSCQISRVIFFQKTAEGRRQKKDFETQVPASKWYEQIVLSPEEIQEIDEELSSIADPELRGVIGCVRRKAAKLEKFRSKF